MVFLYTTASQRLSKRPGAVQGFVFNILVFILPVSFQNIAYYYTSLQSRQTGVVHIFVNTHILTDHESTQLRGVKRNKNRLHHNEVQVRKEFNYAYFSNALDIAF